MRVNLPFTDLDNFPSVPLAFVGRPKSIMNNTEFTSQAELRQQMIEGEGDIEDDVEYSLTDKLHDIEKDALEAHRKCMDIREFLGSQGGSIEANERICVEGIVKVARKLGISKINKSKLLREHSYEAYVDVNDEINSRIDELRKLLSEDEEASDRLFFIGTVLRTIMYKMMALKSPLARGMSVLIAYGTSYTHFEFTPFIILTLAYARINDREQKEVAIQPIITTYDQLYIIKSMALLEMNYHLTSLLNISKEEHDNTQQNTEK